MVKRLLTIPFLGSRRDGALESLVRVLDEMKELQTQSSKSDHNVIIALGNGHGTQECRTLIQESSDLANIPIDIQLVNEAGEFMWNVIERTTLNVFSQIMILHYTYL